MASVRSAQLLAYQTVRPRARDSHLHIFSQKIFARRSEIYDAVARSAPGPLAAGWMTSIDKHFECLTDKLLIALGLNLALAFLQNCVTA